VNQVGYFLELVEYAVGSRKGPIIVPEGHDKQGWKLFAEELGKVMTAFESSSRKLNGGCSQPPLFPLLSKKFEGPSSCGGGVKISCDFGGMGLAPIVGGHHPSFAKVVRATGKPGVPLGKGKELQAFDLMGKTQHGSEARFVVRGSRFGSFFFTCGRRQCSSCCFFPFSCFRVCTGRKECQVRFVLGVEGQT
jgi:hypothetical protein